MMRPVLRDSKRGVRTTENSFLSCRRDPCIDLLPKPMLTCTHASKLRAFIEKGHGIGPSHHARSTSQPYEPPRQARMLNLSISWDSNLSIRRSTSFSTSSLPWCVWCSPPASLGPSSMNSFGLDWIPEEWVVTNESPHKQDARHQAHLVGRPRVSRLGFGKDASKRICQRKQHRDAERMFSLLHGLWSYALRKEEYHILILGIDKVRAGRESEASARHVVVDRGIED